MSENTEQPADGAAPRDPWAPPDNRVPLEKQTGDLRPPAVHDQQTVTSMLTAGTGPVPTAGFGAAPGTGPFAAPGSGPLPGAGQAPGDVPPPPIAPNGPGQQIPPAGQYGYPAAPVPQYGGYPGYPGYGQAPWGGPAPANGLGIASMVLGIVAVVGFCIWGLGVILGVLALIFGLIGRGRVNRGEANNGGVALAGIILGSLGIVISGAFLGFLIWGVTHDFNNEDSYPYDDTYGTSLVVDGTR